MTLAVQPICWRCQHLRKQTPGGTGICDAFLDGIPEVIWENAADHREPFTDDHGIHFAPRDEQAAQYADTLFASDN